MEENDFVITVNYKDRDRDFPAVLRVIGYTHKFLVEVDGREIFFERDEEGSYRAILPAETEKQRKQDPDITLLRLIAEKIESILA